MAKYHGKKDRTARLMKLQILLAQHPEGLDLETIVTECAISQRTFYRDLKVLEYELGVPIWMNHGKYGVAEGHFLPPVNFTTEEAIIIFLSSRLMQNVLYSYNPSIYSMFLKLNTVVPGPLKQKIQNTLESMKSLPVNEKKLNLFNKLTRAWLSQNIVKINYLDYYCQEPVERTIAIYIIEPSLVGHSNYIISYCYEEAKVRVFKMDGIIGDVVIKPETYEIPSNLKVSNFFGPDWDMQIEQEVETVKLHFIPKISRRVKETVWHPSQVTEMQEDGSLIMTLKVRHVASLLRWILGFGNEVEVLEPLSLRRHIAEVVESTRKLYNGL